MSEPVRRYGRRGRWLKRMLAVRMPGARVPAELPPAAHVGGREGGARRQPARLGASRSSWPRVRGHRLCSARRLDRSPTCRLGAQVRLRMQEDLRGAGRL